MESEPITAKKRKRGTKPLVESNNIKSVTESPLRKKVKNKKNKSNSPSPQKQLNTRPNPDHVENLNEVKKDKTCKSQDICKKYPILENQGLIQKFLSVPMTNNQKGRIRQLLKDSLKGTSEFLLPDVIHNRIQFIIKSSAELSETELRKIRILYNMLKKALATEKSTPDGEKKKNKKSKKIDKQEITDIKVEDKKGNKDLKTGHGDTNITPKSVDKKKDKGSTEDSNIVKTKGPKRYVVFVGNLPLDIDKEKLMQHFSEFNECIVDIRIPKRAEGKKSSIAYVELKNEPTYELALSKHHSMLGNKRINVLYTTQKTGKVSRTEAKSKSAKLIALQKAGKLIGSVPVNRKRSHRRMKMKRAQAKLAAESS